MLKQLLILSHRYLGIALSLLAIMWFVTGITMMYVGGMPRLTPELRLDRLPALDLGRITVTPSEAAATAGGGRTQLLSVMDRPAYRVGETTVFADTGEVMDKRRCGVAARRGAVLDADERITTSPRSNRGDQGARPRACRCIVASRAEGTTSCARRREVVTLTTGRAAAPPGSAHPNWLYSRAA